MKVLNFNDFLNENDIYGKYNTIKKVRAVLGKSPSDEEIAQFIKQNYKSKLRMKFRNKMNNLKLPGKVIRELFSEGISSSFYPINFSDLFRSNSTVTNDRFISQYIENNPGQNQEELENAFMRYFLGNR